MGRWDDTGTYEDFELRRTAELGRLRTEIRSYENGAGVPAVQGYFEKRVLLKRMQMTAYALGALRSPAGVNEWMSPSNNTDWQQLETWRQAVYLERSGDTNLRQYELDEYPTVIHALGKKLSIDIPGHGFDWIHFCLALDVSASRGVYLVSSCFDRAA